MQDLETTNLAQHFEKVVKFIHAVTCSRHGTETADAAAAAAADPTRQENAAGSPSVLVHCMYGASRSATCVCAYLMCCAPPSEQSSAGAALAYCTRLRPTVKPNDAFLSQLKQFETSEELVSLREWCSKQPGAGAVLRDVATALAAPVSTAIISDGRAKL